MIDYYLLLVPVILTALITYFGVKIVGVSDLVFYESIFPRDEEEIWIEKENLESLNFEPPKNKSEDDEKIQLTQDDKIKLHPSYFHENRRVRSRLEIYLDVLRSVHEGHNSPTKIMYNSNLSWKPTILTKQLSENDKRTRTKYFITDKGMLFLKYFSPTFQFQKKDLIDTNREERPST